MMKKVLILMLMLSVAVSAAFAQELTNRFSVGLSTGGVIPRDDGMDASWYVGVNGAYGLSEYLALGLELGITSWNAKEQGFDYGDVTAIPFFLDLYVRHPLDMEGRTLVPYAVGGLGVVFWNFNESRTLENNGITVSMDPELGLKLGAGVDYFIDKNLALNLEASYLWSDADVKVGAFGSTASAAIDTDSWFITLGAKYYF